MDETIFWCKSCAILDNSCFPWNICIKNNPQFATPMKKKCGEKDEVEMHMTRTKRCLEIYGAAPVHYTLYQTNHYLWRLNIVGYYNQENK